MHYSIPSYIRRFVAVNGIKQGTVLDVGGADVNGSSASAWKGLNCTYYAADVVGGPGVHHVVSTNCAWDLGKQFDIVFSTSTIEHCERPWDLVPTMARHVLPGGWLFIIAPFAWPQHRHPVDCWRFGPDGMRVLFCLAGIRVQEAGLSRELFWGPRAIHGVRPWLRWLLGMHASHIDCWAWGRKW